MIPREVIGTAEVPGGLPLRLIRHGRDFIIMLERNELMSSRMNGSERALATLTLDRLGHPPAPRILVGGYGMGFTLRALLERVGPKAALVVAELVPGVIEWARGAMAELTAGCLDDRRVELRIADVAEEIAAARGTYDALLLDVDNGPDGLTRAGNDRLYGPAGLAAARVALKRGGILAVWSAGPDPDFTRRLTRASFAVEEQKVRARDNGKGPTHNIWLARAR